MIEQSQVQGSLKLVILQKISIQNAIKFGLGQNYSSKEFYQSNKKQLPQQIYLIKISYQNQQWILVKTDKQCKQLIKVIAQEQFSAGKIVKKIQDAFLNIMHLSKHKTQNKEISQQLQIICQKKGILNNKKFTDFIEFTNIFERYIYRKFKMVKKNGGRYKQSCCKMGLLFSQWKKRQVNIQYNGITYKNQFGQMKQYLPFSHGFQYFFGKCETGNKLGIVLISNHRRLILQAQSPEDFILFLYLLKKKTAESPYLNINRFHSFAPIRENVSSEFYIDGQQYYCALANSLKYAKKSIFITGWMVSPQFLLVRNSKIISLFQLISQKVNDGVQVNMLLYHQSSFLTNDSQYAKLKFQSLGPKVKVLRHPTGKLPILWSHHSKMIIIDKKQAFFGGLDLCYGRYDCKNHQIFPQNQNQKYPGIQYNNCRIRDFEDVRKFTIDHIDRRFPRLPWHDIGQSVTGSIVSDFVHHFVQIWNFASYQNRQVLNKNLLNTPNQHQMKTINNIISTKQSQIDLANDFPGKKKNKILTNITNKIEEVKAKSRQSITVLKSKLYPQKKKKLQELYRKRKSQTDHNNFQDYIASLKKQAAIQQQNDKETKEQKQNNSASISIKNENQIKKKPHKKSIFAKRQEKKDGQNQKNENENYIDFLKNLKIKGDEDIKFQIDQDIDSQQQVPGKIWQNKPYQDQQIQGFNQCQILRSVGNWSIGCSQQKKQFSIHLAYLQLISQAKYFIYIQNQFFISSTEETSAVKNQICNALFRRIKNAVIKKQSFKVYVMLPLLPAFAGNLEQDDCTMLRMIMEWHYKTIKFLLKNIEGLGVNSSDYIQFLGLRSHGVNKQGKPMTQIIYVHSKLMIIDDCTVICGSANINDRSLLGDRDSQIAVVTHGYDEIHGKMNGQNVTVSQKIKQFRIRLWKQHFELDQRILDDPLSESLWNRIQYLTKKNTQIYRNLFGCYPDNQMKTISDLKALKQKADNKQYLEQINQINGNAVLYPYQFLSSQPIQSSVVSKEYFIPTQCLI